VTKHQRAAYGVAALPNALNLHQLVICARILEYDGIQKNFRPPGVVGTHIHGSYPTLQFFTSLKMP